MRISTRKTSVLSKNLRELAMRNEGKMIEREEKKEEEEEISFDHSNFFCF
jgi:hypothetical protein